MEHPRVYYVKCYRSAVRDLWSGGEYRERWVVAYSAADAAEQVLGPLRSVETDQWKLAFMEPVHPGSEQYAETMRAWEECWHVQPAPREDSSRAETDVLSWSANVLSGTLRVQQCLTKNQEKLVLEFVSRLREAAAGENST